MGNPMATEPRTCTHTHVGILPFWWVKPIGGTDCMWPTTSLEIVMGKVKAVGFSAGSRWVRVRVEIFYPDQNPYLAHRFSRY
jgi:hypothetical protein